MKLLIKYGIFFTNILFAILLLICRVIPKINPYEQSFIGILAFIFPVIVIINFCFVIFWLLFRKWLFITVSIIALAFTWNVYAPIWGSHYFCKQNFTKDTTNFTLLSYNVRLLDLYGWSGKKNTRDDIISFFKKENADILCLQEFYTGSEEKDRDNLSKIKNQCQYEYFATCYTHTNKRGNWGSIIFSKFPIVKIENYDIDVFGSNQLQKVNIVKEKDTFSVFNFHLKSNRFSKDESKVAIELENINNDSITKSITTQIYKKLEKNTENRGLEASLIAKIIKENKYPSIACGDLNEIPTSYTYFKMRGNMKDAFLQKGKGLGETFISKLPVLRIDYIFHTLEWDTDGFERIKVDYSDHYPVKVCLKWNHHT